MCRAHNLTHPHSHRDRCVSKTGTRKNIEKVYNSLFELQTTSNPDKMAKSSLQKEFQDQFVDVISRLESKQLFQSDWDIVSFAVFFIFIGVVLLLVLLVLIRCCCCCCCDEQVMDQSVLHSVDPLL
uniref:Small integral membrane protein 22 n=1 Tax=Esox lucius TaxID=8010 RepID=A0AAY5KEU3_ESOLU